MGVGIMASKRSSEIKKERERFFLESWALGRGSLVKIDFNIFVVDTCFLEYVCTIGNCIVLLLKRGHQTRPVIRSRA